MLHFSHPFRLYIHPLSVRVALATAILLHLASWVWILWYIDPRAESIFLHDSMLYGVDAVGEWWRLFFLPVTGAVILLINTFFGWYALRRSDLVPLILSVTSVLCELFILIAVVRLVSLNV